MCSSSDKNGIKYESNDIFYTILFGTNWGFDPINQTEIMPQPRSTACLNVTDLERNVYCQYGDYMIFLSDNFLLLSLQSSILSNIYICHIITFEQSWE